MKLLQCFMGDCQGGFNYIRRLFANLEKKLHFVYRNTFIMKRSTYTISLNVGKKFKKAHNSEMSPQWIGMALAMFKLLAYFLMFSISNGPIATNRLKFLEFFSIFKSPPVLKGQRLHIPTFSKSQFWSKISKN